MNVPTLETKLLLDHAALWGGPKVVLAPPGADVSLLGEGTFWVPDAQARAQVSAPSDAVIVGGVELDAAAPTAVVYLPKGNARRDAYLALAAANAPRIVLVGHVKAGIKTAKKVVGAMGRVTRVEHGRHCQLLVVELGERSKAKALPERRFEVEGMTFVSLPGVFAEGRLDDATALLLAHLELPATGRLLDLGCGAGVIGLVAKRRAPSLDVCLADADDFAVEATRRSAHANALHVREDSGRSREALGEPSTERGPAEAPAKRAGPSTSVGQGEAASAVTSRAPTPEVEVASSDLYAGISGRFDLIVSNPPFHHGVGTEYETTRRLIREAPTHLRPRGELWLVANAFLPWAEVLGDVFADVDTVAETKRFRVVRARRPR